MQSLWAPVIIHRDNTGFGGSGFGDRCGGAYASLGIVIKVAIAFTSFVIV